MKLRTRIAADRRMKKRREGLDSAVLKRMGIDDGRCHAIKRLRRQFRKIGAAA